MLVRLTKKLAEVVDGIDISHYAEGDVIDLPEPHARMLVAEGWGELVPQTQLPTVSPARRPNTRAVAADGGRKHSGALDDPRNSP